VPALERLGADEVRALVVAYRGALEAHQGLLDRLNVFPVPDGDTGTNLVRTLDAVVDEVGTGPGDLAATCRAVAAGALMGARGNSGVILSQVLRGFTGALAAAGAAAGPTAVAEGLAAAALAARAAVLEPVEGTMLTVADAAAAAATAAAAAGADLVGVLDAAREAATEAVARTPELLPALAEAGVVDAGGVGVALLLDAALAVVDERRVSVPNDGRVPEAPPPPVTLSGPRFEVTYLVEATDDDVAGLRRRLGDLGDSVALSGGTGTWSCHVHTDDVTAAIEAGAAVGRPRRIEVTDLAEQVAARCAGEGEGEGD